MEKSWTDQPDTVEESRVVFKAYFNSRLVEVRDAGGGWYLVSVGNIFGSQTLSCASAAVTFQVLEKIANRADDDTRMTLPYGTEVIANA